MKAFLILLFLLLQLTHASTEYSAQDFKSDLFTPYTDESTRKIWTYGTGLTTFLIVFRDEIVEPFQEDMAREEPMGEFSQFGDLMGQLIPNVTYMVYQQYYSDDPKAKSKAKGMLKSSYFAGFSTFFLKRIFNQQRPNKGDRNSFPSGHTTTAFAFASYVAETDPEYAYWSYALGAIVGLSRINDNAHYLHDVTMGSTIGTAFGTYFAKETNADNDLSFNFFPLDNGSYVGINYRF